MSTDVVNLSLPESSYSIARRVDLRESGPTICPLIMGNGGPLPPDMTPRRRLRADGKLLDIPDNYVPGSDMALPSRRLDVKRKSRAQEAEERAIALFGKAPPKSVRPPEVMVEVSLLDDGPRPTNGKLGQVMAKLAQKNEWQERMESANPVQLALILMRQLDKDGWIRWEPETVWREIEARMGFSPTQTMRDKILATRLVVGTERFHKEWPIFEKTVIALNGRPPTFDVIQHVSPEEIARAMSWARRLQDRPYSDEVLAYIAVACHEEGVLCLPDPLEPAQPFLDRINRNKELCPKVRQHWELVKNWNLKTLEIKENDPVSIQMVRMASISDAARTA